MPRSLNHLSLALFVGLSALVTQASQQDESNKLQVERALAKGLKAHVDSIGLPADPGRLAIRSYDIATLVAIWVPAIKGDTATAQFWVWGWAPYAQGINLRIDRPGSYRLYRLVRDKAGEWRVDSLAGARAVVTLV